jgi:hypothetical protein
MFPATSMVSSVHADWRETCDFLLKALGRQLAMKTSTFRRIFTAALRKM